MSCNRNHSPQARAPRILFQRADLPDVALANRTTQGGDRSPIGSCFGCNEIWIAASWGLHSAAMVWASRSAFSCVCVRFQATLGAWWTPRTRSAPTSSMATVRDLPRLREATTPSSPGRHGSRRSPRPSSGPTATNPNCSWCWTDPISPARQPRRERCPRLRQDAQSQRRRPQRYRPMMSRHLHVLKENVPHAWPLVPGLSDRQGIWSPPDSVSTRAR